MKALLIVSASVALTATLANAMPEYRLLASPAPAATTPASSGYLNTQLGYSDLAQRPTNGPTGSADALVQTNFTDPHPLWALDSGGGGFGGSTSPFNRPEIGPVPVAPNSFGGTGGDGGQTAVIVQPNGPALPVPEPSSSWLLLALAVIPILKLRGSRKIRAS